VLARECHLLGRTEAAFDYLKELTKTGTLGERELSLYLSSVGEHAFQEGDEKDARKLLQRALKHDSKNSLALYVLGSLNDKTGHGDAAVEHWKKAAFASPELSGSALQNLERVMFQSGRFSDVERVYREVLEARPGDEYATLALASFYKKQGRGGEAIEILEDFRSLRPDSVGATLLLTSLYATLKDAEALEKFLDENESYYARTGGYTCNGCGFQAATMRWHCPRCNRFDTFSETHEA
jgi:lipopolysaccharide biosynthesis regulator YciM